jgi:hypothetical protein
MIYESPILAYTKLPMFPSRKISGWDYGNYRHRKHKNHKLGAGLIPNFLSISPELQANIPYQPALLLMVAH